MYVCVFGIGSKTTEPIELKFTHNLCGDPVKVIGNFFFLNLCVCLSVCPFFVRKKTFFSNISKTTEPIELKFIYKTQVSPRVVLGVCFFAPV